MIVISTDTVVIFIGTKRDCQWRRGADICYCDKVIFLREYLMEKSNGFDCLSRHLKSIRKMLF